ncbi:MAG: hypothetical protein D9C04_05650 [Nitrosopumilus sp. B06]|nr:MAG: hypothetical protein D9C04_05650 [Nitrosopumilus sp. B06]
MAYSNIQIFCAELTGTFLLVVFATGAIVYDDRVFDSSLGVAFAALAPFIALLIGVYAFGKISLAHFNPAVTLGYYITGHINKVQAAYYVVAEISGAFLATVFVMSFVGTNADLGANAPNYEYTAYLIIPVEILASALLMGVILCVVYTRGLRGFSGVAIGGIVGLDILFFSAISGASMNPARALAPALFSGNVEHLWLYLTAPFVGAMLAGIAFRGRFGSQR